VVQPAATGDGLSVATKLAPTKRIVYTPEAVAVVVVVGNGGGTGSGDSGGDAGGGDGGDSGECVNVYFHLCRRCVSSNTQVNDVRPGVFINSIC
jgi:hypothetical protein